MNESKHLVAHTHPDLTSCWIAAVIILVGYFLPTIIAFMCGHYRKGAILFLNIIIGWTGFGWLYLMSTALEFILIGTKRRVYGCKTKVSLKRIKLEAQFREVASGLTDRDLGIDVRQAAAFLESECACVSAPAVRMASMIVSGETAEKAGVVRVRRREVAHVGAFHTLQRPTRLHRYRGQIQRSGREPIHPPKPRYERPSRDVVWLRQ